MDVKSIIFNDGYTIPNYDYNPKTKKGREQSPYLKTSNMEEAHPFVKQAYDLNATKSYRLNADEYRKYLNAGITVNPWEDPKDWDRQLAESQSAITKFGNAIAQTVISEVALGTAKGISDLVDIVGGEVFRSDNDYSNPVSQYLGQLQEDFKNYAPIYSDPDKNIANGGLLDAGWWASNLPSIASSLTLLIPSTGIVRGVAALGKLNSVQRFTNNAIKFAKGTKFLKPAVSSENLTKLGQFTEIGTTAALSRVMENYQESRQVYNDVKDNILNTITSPDYSPEDYQKLIQRNASILEGVDTNDKEAVANVLAYKSANETFKDDFVNVVFDVAQLYGLRNAWKGFRAARGSSSLEKANQRVIETAGKSAKEIQALDAAKGFVGKRLQDLKYAVKGGYKTVLTESTEGVEEAINYIAQQEGTHLGQYLLDGKNDSSFDTRLSQYVKAPQLWDSAFWGFLGGIVFQGLGSSFKRLQHNLEKGLSKKDVAVEENKKRNWWKFEELPEIKRRKANIEYQGTRLNTLFSQIDEINAGRNPFAKSNEDKVFEDTEEGKFQQELARQKAMSDFEDDIVINSANNGNIDYLREFLRSNEVRDALVEKGVINREEANAKQQELVKRIDEIEDMYDQEVNQLNDIASESSVNIPMEYLQIIANNNVRGRIAIQRYNEAAKLIEDKVRRTEELVKDELGSNEDGKLNIYRQLVELQSNSQELSVLYAEKKRIENDKEFSKTLTGQVQLDDINKKIKTLENKLFDDTNDYTLGTSLWIRMIAPRAIWNEDKTIGFDNSSESIEAIDQFLSGKFDDFLKSFGSTKKSSDFNLENIQQRVRVINQDIARIVPRKDRRTGNLTSELDDINPTLKHNYQLLSAYNTAILYEQAQLTHTVSDVLHYANVLNNTMSESRAKAVGQAVDIIKEIADKYPDIQFAHAIDNAGNMEKVNELISTMPTADRNKFMEQLEILELTKDSNKPLGVELANILAKHQFTKMIESAAEIEKDGENSSTSEEPEISTQSQPLNNQSQQNAQTITEPETTLNEAQSNQSQQVQEPQQQTSSNPIGSKKLIDKDTTNFGFENASQGFIKNKHGIWVPVVSSIRTGYKLENGESVLGGTLISAEPLLNRGNVVIQDGAGGHLEISADMVVGLVRYDDKTNSNIDITNDIQQQVEAVQSTISSTGGQESNVAVPESTNKIEIDKIDGEINRHSLDFFKEHITNNIPITKEEYDNTMASIISQTEDETYAKAIANEFFKNFTEVVADNEEKAHLVKDIVLNSSTLTEQTNTFSDAYKKAIYNLLKAYTRAAGINKIKGTYHISLEHLLKYCNSLSSKNTNSPARLIYNQLRDYLVTEKPEGYEVYDLNEATNRDFLDKVEESVTSRIERAKKDGMQRIGIRSYIEYLKSRDASKEEIDKTLKEIDKIVEGDALTYDINGNMITIKHNNVGVGSLLIPEVAQGKYSNLRIDRDALIGETGGWRWDTITRGNEVESKFGNRIIKILNDNSTEAKDIVKVLRDIGRPTITRSEKEEILSSLKNNNIWDDLKKDFAGHRGSDLTRAESLSRVFIYGELANLLSRDEEKKNAVDSFKLWLSYLNNSYEQSMYLANNPETKLVVESKFRGTQNTLKAEEARPVNSKGTIADKYKGRIRIAIGSIEENGVLETSASDEIPNVNKYSKVTPNSTFVIIPDGNGNHTYVHAFPAKLSDNFVSPTIKTIRNEVRQTILESFKELYKKVNTVGSTQQDYITAMDSARKTLIKLLDNNPSYGGVLNYPLLLGLRVNRVNDFEINIYKNSGESLSIRATKNNTMRFLYNGKEYSLTSMSPEKLTDFIMGIIDRNTIFNIGHEFIKSDNERFNLAGLASRTKDGKFQIKIGNFAPHIFDSFNDFIIENNLVKVTTYVGSNGDNFSLVSNESQLSNTAIHYKRVGQESSATPPVEESFNNTSRPKTKSEKAIDFINNNESFTGQEIAEILLDKKSSVLNELINKGLLPEKVRFNKDLIGNARVQRTTGFTELGQGFIDILRNGDYRQAIRKLVHERLHNLIETEGETDRIRTDIREIYDAFVKSNPNEDLHQYVDWNKEDRYWDAENNTLTDEGIEEFFVESITSGELARYLNSVDSTKEAKYSEVKEENKSLWQKIIDILTRLLGRGNSKLNIKDNTLFAQEMLLLSDNISKINNEETKEENKIQTERKSKRVRYNRSSLQENNSKSSVRSLIEKLPIESQENMTKLINDGVINMTCK